MRTMRDILVLLLIGTSKEQCKIIIDENLDEIDQKINNEARQSQKNRLNRMKKEFMDLKDILVEEGY